MLRWLLSERDAVIPVVRYTASPLYKLADDLFDVGVEVM